MGGGPMREHILITLPLPEPSEEIAQLKTEFPGTEVLYRDAQEGPVPENLYKDVTVLFTLFGLRSAVLPPDPKRTSPNLQYVHFYSAGINRAVEHPIYTESDIPLTTASGVHGPQIAEWSVMTRLVQSRAYNLCYEMQKDCHWDPRNYNNSAFLSSRDQVGQRVGILGYGAIGRQIGRMCQAMGMAVTAYTASPKPTPESRRDNGYIVPGTGDPEGTIPAEWYSGTSKEELHAFLGADLDWVVVSVPLTPATKHLLGGKEFEVLSKKKAFLSNISRGDILIQDELIEALKSKDKGGKGLLRGAALDVTSPEPLPSDSELWRLDGVTITPHISGLSANYTTRCFEILKLNLRRKANGEKLINEVNKKKGY